MEMKDGQFAKKKKEFIYASKSKKKGPEREFDPLDGFDGRLLI